MSVTYNRWEADTLEPDDNSPCRRHQTSPILGDEERLEGRSHVYCACPLSWTCATGFYTMSPSDIWELGG